MSIINYWKQFESTGKVEDYLLYCGSLSDVERLHNAGKLQSPVNRGATADDEQLGANSYAGIHKCDGNSIKANAYRGI